MPLPDEVRSLLELSIEILVIGGGLPALFLERPAWLRDLRERYSLWRWLPWAEKWNGLVTIPVVLGAIMLGHIGLAAGWWSVPRGYFYGSLVLSLILVALLWYQVGMTGFTQVAQRIFWFAWYDYKRRSFPCKPPLEEGHGNARAPTDIPRGWPWVLAWVQAWFPRATWRQRAIRDLGRLGANTRTPQETRLVLTALSELAKVVPLDTSGKHSPVEQLCEATLHSLWPIKSSDEEAFRLAIQVFDTVLKRWARARQQAQAASNDNGCQARQLAEGPMLPHLTKLGQALAEYHPYLLHSDEFLRVFDVTDHTRDNHQEAEALFEIGMHALRLGRWDPLLHITTTLHRYAQVGVGAWREDVPLVHAAQDAYERRQELDEGFIWYLGLVAMMVHTAPATLPWVRRELGLHEPLCAHDQANRRAWEAVCREAARFFTRRVLKPTVAAAVTCLCAHMCAPHTATEPLPCDALGGGTATPPPVQGPQGAS